jgi:hypothetical protein
VIAVADGALEKATAITEAIAAEVAAHTAAVESLAVDHAGKQAMLEDLLLKAQEEVAASLAAQATAIAERDATSVEVESLRLKVASTEVPLPPAAKTKLNQYSEARARLVALEETADTSTLGACRLAASRQEVSDLFEEMATGTARKPPSVTAHVSNTEIRARRADDGITRQLRRAIATNHVPLNAALGCCEHHTGVMIVADLELTATTEGKGDISEEEEAALLEQVQRKESEHDLRTQKGRVNAAVAAISHDLKRIFAIRRDRYRTAVNLSAV